MKKFLIEFFKRIFHSALVEKGNVSFNIEIIILDMRNKLICFKFIVKTIVLKNFEEHLIICRVTKD